MCQKARGPTKKESGKENTDLREESIIKARVGIEAIDFEANGFVEEEV